MFKALALGATAVGIGRPALYSMAGYGAFGLPPLSHHPTRCGVLCRGAQPCAKLKAMRHTALRLLLLFFSILRRCIHPDADQKLP